MQTAREYSREGKKQYAEQENIMQRARQRFGLGKGALRRTRSREYFSQGKGALSL